MIKESAYAAFFFSGVTSLAAWRHKRHAAVLMYHGATDQKWSGVLNCERNHIAIEALAKQLHWIKKNRNVTTLARYAQSLRGGEPIPEHSVILTFDDGYENNYSLIYPLLQELNLPAVFFVATDFIKNRETLWVDRLESAFHSSPCSKLELSNPSQKWQWNNEAERIAAYLDVKSKIKGFDGKSRDTLMSEAIERLKSGPQDIPNLFDPMTPNQLRKLSNSNLIEIGAHSCRHDILTHLNDSDARKEIVNSRSQIEEFCGKSPALFSYPNGEGGPRLAKIVEEANYAAAVEGSLHLNPPRGVSPYRIDRIALHENDTIPIIAATLGGLRQYLMPRG